MNIKLQARLFSYYQRVAVFFRLFHDTNLIIRRKLNKNIVDHDSDFELATKYCTRL